MNVAFPEHQYIPSCFDSACNAFVKLVFQYEQTVVMEDIPLTATCREVRNYLVQKSLFPSLPSLTGWRLLFSSVILDDDAPISTYSLPQCARIQLCRIDEEETPTLPKRPYLNAATTPAIPLSNGAKRVLLRTIEHSKEVAPSSVVLVAPTEATVPEEAAVVTKPVEYEDDYFPVLRREGYYMRPSHFDMRELSKEQLQHLRRFTVGREGAGEICWEGETDVTYLNLDERVLIERDLQGIPYVHVYPPELFMNVLPPVGSELNKTATVRLFNMFPRTARSESGLQRYADMLRRQVEVMGAEWVGYNGDQGIMEFRIQHFLPVCNRHFFWSPKVGFARRSFIAVIFSLLIRCCALLTAWSSDCTYSFPLSENAGTRMWRAMRFSHGIHSLCKCNAIPPCRRTPVVFDLRESDAKALHEFQQRVRLPIRRA